jgi:hypothetical protein
LQLAIGKLDHFRNDRAAGRVNCEEAEDERAGDKAPIDLETKRFETVRVPALAGGAGKLVSHLIPWDLNFLGDYSAA